MSVFQGGGATLDVTPKKLQSQKSRRFEKIVTVKLKNAKKRVLKSPAQMAFWTFFEKYKYLYFLCWMISFYVNLSKHAFSICEKWRRNELNE